ncbi:glycosyltransferase family 2 protein [Undibacterium sp. Rencai35W]|uniref:glycosyltransferase family 2 protein n=1 Tax=Undibacterium sp. Rencai35W TaxID=3413046 RepID=UPI003BF106CE
MTNEPSDLSAPLIAAVVVGFFPEVDVLQALLSRLHTQVQQLYLVDNGGCDALDLSALPGCQHIKLDKNYGLGYALNKGFEAANKNGASYVATFDQDSAPPDNLIATLFAQHLLLKNKQINCAAIGPSFFDRREIKKVYFPFYKEGTKGIQTILPQNHMDNTKIVEVDVLITSGMLIRTDAWLDTLRYDDGMFVDYTDTEWCFRARDKGYRLFGSTEVQMGHALSDAPPVRLFKLNFFHYSALRRYYYFRNTLLICKKPYVSAAWKKRLLTGLALRFIVSLFYESKRWSQFIMMCKGIWAGLHNKNGAYSK